MTCYVMNSVLVRPLLSKTPYELWNNKKPNVSYFKIFGCKCFILNEKDALGNIDANPMKGFFLAILLFLKPFVSLTKELWL